MSLMRLAFDFSGITSRFILVSYTSMYKGISLFDMGLFLTAASRTLLCGVFLYSIMDAKLLTFETKVEVSPT